VEQVPAQRSANQKIARAAGTVMAAFVFSNLVGLARTMVITHAFGTSAGYDAFNAANRVAELLFNLVAGGALASAFIPTLTGFLVREDRAGAWRLASGVINLAALALALISALAALFAPQIVRYGLFVLAPGSPPEQLDLTIALLRIMLPSVVIFGVSGLLMGILNAHQVFLIPAVAPAMYSLGMILGTWLLGPGMGIRGLAWGVVLGAGLHLLVQLPALLRLAGRRFFVTLGLRSPAVIEVLRLMAPRLLGVAVVQLNFIANTIIALGQPEGSVSYITVAFALMLMPEMAIAQSTAIAALPTFSAQVARGRLDEMRASLAAALRAVLLLSVPASVGLMLLREPLVRLLYERGAFTPESTRLVAWALLWYAAGLVGHSLVEVISRAFYALHDTQTPVKVGVAAMTLNIILSLWISRLFAQAGLPPHGGLALANTIATTLEAVALLALMRRRLRGLEGGRVWRAAGQALAGSALMGLLVWGWLRLSAGGHVAVVALGGLALGLLGYAAVMALLRVPELRALVSAVARRIRR
jgi:putative peptidoglycan lipid II flippase